MKDRQGGRWRGCSPQGEADVCKRQARRLVEAPAKDRQWYSLDQEDATRLEGGCRGGKGGKLEMIPAEWLYMYLIGERTSQSVVFSKRKDRLGGASIRWSVLGG